MIQPIPEDALPELALDQIRAGTAPRAQSVTRAELAERALRQQYRFLQTLIDAIPDLIFVKDRSYRVTLVNKAFCEVSGLREDELIGKTAHDLYPKDIADVFKEMDDQLFETGKPNRNEEWFVAADGRKLRMDTTKVPYFGLNGEVVGIMAIARDITTRWAREEERAVLMKQLRSALVQLREERAKLRDANERLTMLSQRDGLTGVHNRRALDERLESEWNRCRREQTELSFILIDIDHFKAFNDHYGHLAGDDCLKRVASELVDQAHRASDFVARYGGEEFAVLVSGGDMESAGRVAEACRLAIHDLAVEHEASPDYGRVTISAGVSTVLPGADLTVTDLIQKADDNLYLAKRTRNCVRA